MPSGFFPEYKQNAYMLFGRTNEKEQPGIPWERRVIRGTRHISKVYNKASMIKIFWYWQQQWDRMGKPGIKSTHMWNS